MLYCTFVKVYSLTVNVLQFRLHPDWPSPVSCVTVQRLGDSHVSGTTSSCFCLSATVWDWSLAIVLFFALHQVWLAPSGLYRNSQWSLFRADMLEIETQLISSAPIKHSHFISAFWLHVAYFGFCLYYKTSPCKSKWMEPYVPIHTNVFNMYQYGGSGPLVGLLQVKENY